MRPSEAYYKTFDLVTNLCDSVFSLGYNYFELHPFLFGILGLPFYFSGKMAKFVIGYPLGFIIGGIAASAVAMRNKMHAPLNVGQMKQDTPQPPIEYVISAAEDLMMKAYAEKKDKLLSKIDSLKLTIQEKIDAITVIHNLYDKTLGQYHGLKNQLIKAKENSKSAKKFSHNRIETTTEQRIVHHQYNMYGSTMVGSYHYHNISMFNHGTDYGYEFYEVKNEIPVYVPDLKQRENAEQKALMLEQQLKEEFNNSPPIKPDGYERKDTLLSYIAKLDSLKSTVSKLPNNAESKLLSCLANFKSLLVTINAFFSSHDEPLNHNTFLPKSDYAANIVTAKLINQCARQNRFFGDVPAEVRELIAISSNQSSLAEQDVRMIYRTAVSN